MVVSHRTEHQQVKMFAFEMHPGITLNEEMDRWITTFNKQITKRTILISSLLDF